jgi:hypothetical protein
MAGKCLHIQDEDRLLPRNGYAADAFAHRNADASGLALKGPHDELVPVAQKIKARPIDIRQAVIKEGRRVCGVRDQVTLAFQQ